MADVFKRRLKLVNFKGEELDLLGAQTDIADPFALPFLENPDGFGFQIKTDVQRAINEDILLSATYEFPDITGDLLFYTYEKYDEFRNFVMRSQDLTNLTYDNTNTFKLFYQTDEDKDKLYYNVILKSLEKSEKNEQEILRSKVVFQRLSHLKEDIILEQQNNVDVGEIRTFPLPTPESNFIKFNKSDVSSTFRFVVNNKTNLIVPTKITITGRYKNPSWKNLKNGLEGRYFVNSSGEFIIDANNPQEVTNNGTNAIDTIDNSKFHNFLYFSPGINIVSFSTDDSGVAGGFSKVTIEYSREII